MHFGVAERWRQLKALYEEGRKKDSEVFKDDIKLDRHISIK
jgi:hypothetical protein